ncbi:hypothetical protein [Streptomyces sp. NPDC048309]|uniref:hypothetical protein n=1 Tax=unclassified Streptomyces TaxID=2593676 RepID=UPI0033D007EC
MRDAQRGITEPLYDLKAKNLAVDSGTIDDHPIGDSASPIGEHGDIQDRSSDQ